MRASCIAHWRGGKTSKKTLITAFLVLSTTTTSLAQEQIASCKNADPSSVLAQVGGDFELTLDPQDPLHNLIYVANTSSGAGASNVVVAHVDGVTGQVVPGSRTTIGNNYDGKPWINGPELLQKPNGQLGVVYAGQGGVHATFRPAVPLEWNDFILDVNGAPTNGSPPLLPNAISGAYPASPFPFGQYTYGQFDGGCQGVCYGALYGGATTDVFGLLYQQGFTSHVVIQGMTDGYIYISACDATNTCGLYEAQIDGQGGFVANSFQKITSVGTAPQWLAAAIHPVTGTTVLFSNKGTTAIDIWEQPATGGALKHIADAPVINSEHYRALVSDTQVVLHYLIRSGAGKGDYTIPVSANGTNLVVGASTLISTVAIGTEVVWLPPANRWAIYYRNQHLRPAQGMTLCWVTP